MAPERPLTVSGIAYKVKDWAVIVSAIFGIFMWGTKFASIPPRVDKLEASQISTTLDLVELKTNVKYLVKQADKNNGGNNEP